MRLTAERLIVYLEGLIDEHGAGLVVEAYEGEGGSWVTVYSPEEPRRSVGEINTDEGRPER